MKQASAEIQNRINDIAGVTVEITVIGENHFSFMFDAINEDAAKNVADFMGSDKCEIHHDEECGVSVIFFDGREA